MTSGLEEIIFETVYLALVFFVGLGLARLLVPFSGRIAVALGVVDRPDARKVHSGAMPRMGGLAIALALFATLLLCVRLADSALAAFLLGAAIVVFTGLLDDTVGISPKMKFLGEILAAAVFVAVSGISLVSFGDLLGFGEIRTGWLGPLLTIFCMVGVMNALNLSDGLDGLAGGLSFIAALLLAAVAYEHQAWYWSVLALGLLGVLLGFLRHNHFPASLFMGDTGSLLLGYTLAAIAVGLAWPGGDFTPVEPVSLGILLALPIADTIWVMARRLLAGANPFRPDKTHLHHRLLRLGLGHAGVVSIFYLLMLAFATLAWYGRVWPEWGRLYAVLVAFVVLYGGLAWLERRQADLGSWVDSVRLFRRRRSWNVQTGVGGRLRQGVMLLVVLLLVVPLAGLLPVPRVLGLFALVAALFVFLLFPWRADRRRMHLGQGVLYLAGFCLLIIYLFAPERPPWVLPLLYAAAGLAFCWVLVMVATSRRSLVLYPSGFEILMLFLSWSFPLVVLPMLTADSELRWGITTACVLALPLLCLGKLTLTRRPAPNTRTAAVFILIFLSIGLTAFLR